MKDYYSIAQVCSSMETQSHPSTFSVESLQTLCVYQVIHSLDCYSPELLCCIPPSLRYQIYTRSPIVDICHFENTIAFDGIHHEALWGELYQNHWEHWDQWSSEEFVTHKNLEFLPAGISNREKYFAFITTVIFCAERPSGYIENLDTSSGNRCESVPEEVMNCYPTDVVNYLVAFEKSVNADPGNMYDIPNIYPVPQRELDNSIDDGRLSCNYDRLATKRQCIPQRYSNLVKEVSRLSDSDALLLMMDKCNYNPEWIAFSCRENIQWCLKDETLLELLSRFFCRLQEVHLNIIDETDEACDDIALSTCFATPSVSSLSLHLLCEVDHLYLLSGVSNLRLTKLHISSPFDFTDTAVKELAEILLKLSNVSDLEIGELGECSFPDDSYFLSNVAGIITNPQFRRFSFEGCEMSSAAVSKLLFAFFSTVSSCPQGLYLRSGIVIASDGLRLQSPMSSSICVSALQHKTLKVDYCCGKMCLSLLSLRPLSLRSISLVFTSNSRREVCDILETVANNDRLQVQHLRLALAYVLGLDDPQVSLPEIVLISIFKRSTLKSLALDLRWNAIDLNVLTNALSVQLNLGSLEKLTLTFDKLEGPETFCDLEHLIDLIFNLPQISIFSFDFDIHLSDFHIIETIHKHWQAKRPKEFCFGHFVEMEVSEHVQSTIEEMELIFKQEVSISAPKPSCQHPNFFRLYILSK